MIVDPMVLVPAMPGLGYHTMRWAEAAMLLVVVSAMPWLQVGSAK